MSATRLLVLLDGPPHEAWARHEFVPGPDDSPVGGAEACWHCQRLAGNPVHEPEGALTLAEIVAEVMPAAERSAALGDAFMARTQPMDIHRDRAPAEATSEVARRLGEQGATTATPPANEVAAELEAWALKIELADVPELSGVSWSMRMRAMDFRDSPPRPAPEPDELVATLADLAAVVGILRRDGGYLTPADQLALGAAKARLARLGGGVPDPRAMGTPGAETARSGGRP